MRIRCLERTEKRVAVLTLKTDCCHKDYCGIYHWYAHTTLHLYNISLFHAFSELLSIRLNIKHGRKPVNGSLQAPNIMT